MGSKRSTPSPTTVACPTCGRPVVWGPDAPERPFCSRRCRLIDLGEWLDGGRAIPGDEGTELPEGGDSSGTIERD
jgi:hypothetical protein